MPAEGFRALAEFFSLSPIHGCTYIAFGRTIAEVGVWLIALIVCAGFCVRDSATLVALYETVPTALAMDMQRNSTLSLPNVAWCFDVFRTNVVPSVSAAFDEALLNRTLASLASMNVTSLAMLPPDDASFDYVMKVTYLMLMAIVDYDLGVPGIAQFDSRTKRAVSIVQTYFSNIGCDYDYLAQETARYLCKQAQLPSIGGCTMKYYAKGARNKYTSSCVDVCSNGTLSWFGQTASTVDDACFLIAPALGGDLFTSAADMLTVQPYLLTRGMQLVSDWGPQNYVIPPNIQYGAPMAYFDMRGWEGLMDLRYSDSVNYINDGTESAIGVEVVSTYVAYNNSVNPCQSQTEAECAMECLVATRLASADACWPLAALRLVAKKPPSTPLCTRVFTPSQVAAANATAQALTAWYECLYVSCAMRPCEQSLYQFKPETGVSSSGINVTIYGSKFVFPAFEEVLIMNTSEFLWAFGGILGLWLGSSVIALSHIIGYIIASVVFASKKGTVGKEVVIEVEMANAAY